MPRVNRNRLIICLSIVTLLCSFLSEKEKIKYTQEPTIAGVYKKKQLETVSYGDSLFLVKTKQGIPLHYFKNITTEVCFDQECRLLKITVYWNITGRYLGFELLKGEFLSKHDHEPFVAAEYERLNELLANPSLPLGNISFEKLIQLPEKEEEPVDGISGATTLEVAKMVVKGAAYTTFTLWNIVHGPTQDHVANLTEKQLSPGLIDLILKSPDINDRVWVLNRVGPNTVLNPKLTATLLGLISGNDFFLAYSAINAIKASHLQADTLQFALFSIYKEADHSIQTMIIEKLMTAPYLSLAILSSSRSLLDQLNGKQLADLLKLYTKHSINDLETQKAVAEILKNENHFISRQAYRFLIESNSSEVEITELLDKYRERE